MNDQLLRLARLFVPASVRLGQAVSKEEHWISRCTCDFCGEVHFVERPKPHSMSVTVMQTLFVLGHPVGGMPKIVEQRGLACKKCVQKHNMRELIPLFGL